MDALTALRELVACRDLTNTRPPQEHEWDREQAAWAAARAVLSDYDAGGARPLVLNSGEAMPQGQNAAETTPGALPASPSNHDAAQAESTAGAASPGVRLPAASPLSAATSLANAGHVDGPSQEGAGDSAATLDDLVARLRSLQSGIDGWHWMALQAARERDEARALVAAMTQAGTQMQQERDAANARASALHDDAERYRWLRDSCPGPSLEALAGVNDRSYWDGAIDSYRLAKPVEP